MPKIDIKPLSANELWTGRRFPTPKYKKYTSDVLFLLPKLTIPEGNLQLNIEVGLSNSLQDIDNVNKGFVDCLQKKYGFNDNRIFGLNMTKIIVPKGSEFINFEIKKYE